VAMWSPAATSNMRPQAGGGFPTAVIEELVTSFPQQSVAGPRELISTFPQQGGAREMFPAPGNAPREMMSAPPQPQAPRELMSAFPQQQIFPMQQPMQQGYTQPLAQQRIAQPMQPRGWDGRVPATMPMEMGSRTPPMPVPVTGPELRPPRGHWEWQAERPVMTAPAPIQVMAPPVQTIERQMIVPQMQQQVQERQVIVPQMQQPQIKIVEKEVFIERPPQIVEKIVERIVERIVEVPVYIDREVPMQVPYPQSGNYGMQEYGVQERRLEGTDAVISGMDHHHIVERPVYVEIERERDRSEQTVIREIEVVERPVYIEIPVPVPYERPVPVPVPQSQLQRTQPRTMYERQFPKPNNDFPYHNPYPEMGCDFTNRNLQATNEPDPIKAFLENFKGW